MTDNSAHSTADWQARWAASMTNNYGTPAVALTGGSGAVVTDADGREYLDLLGGIAVNALGHGHPAITAAVTEQLATLGHTSNLYISPPAVELAEKLLARFGVDGSRVFFCNSGTEANEAAFKLARLTGRPEIVAAEKAFHGRTMGSLAMTGQPAKRAPFEPMPEECASCPTATPMRSTLPSTRTPPRSSWNRSWGERRHRAARRLPRPRPGDHRRTRCAAHLRRGADRDRPDRHVLRPPGRRCRAGCDDAGQGARRRLPDRSSDHRPTGRGPVRPGHAWNDFRRQSLQCGRRAGSAHDDRRRGLVERVATLGKSLAAGIEDLDHPLIDHVRGSGLLLGVVLRADVAKAAEAAARDAGFLVNAPDTNILRLAPPLVLTDEQAQSFIDALPAILDTAQGEQP